MPCCSLPPALLPPFSWQKVEDRRVAFPPLFGDGKDSPPRPVILAVITPLVMASTQFGFTIGRRVGYIVQRVIILF